MFYAGVNVSIALLRLLLRRPVGRLARGHGRSRVNLLVRLMTLAAAGSWVIYAMDNFRILRPTYAVVGAALSREFALGEISISLGHVLIFLVSSILVFWTARGVRLLLHDEVLPRMSLPRGVGNSVASLSYYGLLLAGFLLALSAAGFKVSELTLVFGALGVGVGFGLQSVVNNFVSGLILMFERPIQPGDVIEIRGMSGRVADIGMRATRIRTFEGADVVVPNGSLLSESLTNWTLLDSSRRIDVSVGVSYESDPARVSELLKETVVQTAGVAAQPGPEVFFTGFGASSLDFVVRAWTYEYDSWVRIRSDLVTRVHAALAKAGIAIPYPQHDLHLRSVSEAVGSLVRAPAERPPESR
jgi:small-conductance mechanosensitive channel